MELFIGPHQIEGRPAQDLEGGVDAAFQQVLQALVVLWPQAHDVAEALPLGIQGQVLRPQEGAVRRSQLHQPGQDLQLLGQGTARKVPFQRLVLPAGLHVVYLALPTGAQQGNHPVGDLRLGGNDRPGA